MNVLVVGGSGVVGRGVAKGLAQVDGIKKVVLTANTRIDLAREIAVQIGPKAKAISLNVRDREEMVRRMKEAHLVVNLCGPSSKYAVPVAEAAIQAGRNYVDVNDDAESLPGLFALDHRAKRAGLTMLVCTGASPGQSNLLARYGADKMDRVDEINILWACGINIAGDTPANWGHRLNMYAQTVPIFDNGKIVQVPGGSGEQEVDWPAPVGRLVHRYCGHSEPITLPRYIGKGLRRVSCKGAITPGEINHFFKYLGELGFAETCIGRFGDVTTSPFEFMRHYVSSPTFQSTIFCRQLIAREKEIGPNFELRVEALGERDGKNTRVVCTQIGPDRNSATYIPTWVMSQMVLEGNIRRKGVFCPEALGLDPRPIIDRIEKAGGSFWETLEEL